MSDQDYENTIAKLDARIEELQAKYDALAAFYEKVKALHDDPNSDESDVAIQRGTPSDQPKAEEQQRKNNSPLAFGVVLRGAVQTLQGCLVELGLCRRHGLGVVQVLAAS